MTHFFFHPGQNRETAKKVVVFNSFIVLLVVGIIFGFAFSRLRYDFNWDGIWKYREKFVQGFRMTVTISFAALFVSLFVGTVTALARASRFLPLRFLSRLYIELIRGTPLLVQILVFYYVVADAFHLQDRYVAGVLILGLFAGAYVTEIIRGGIESIGESQHETARSLGLGKLDTFVYVVFPQMFRRILPPLAGQLASLIKDSSLLSIISVSEFTLNAQEVNAFTYSTLESYLPLALGYFLLTYPISHFARYLEKRFTYAT